MTIWSPFLADFLVIVALAGLGIGAMFAGYRMGGSAWGERFSVQLRKPDGSVLRQRGERGEAVMLLLLAVTLVFVNRMTPDVTMLGLAAEFPQRVAGTFVALLGGCVLYGLYNAASVARKELTRSPSYIRDLRRGYWLYDLYSTINFGCILLIGTMIVLQFQTDALRVDAQRERVAGLLEQLATLQTVGPAAMQPAIETVYGEVLIGASFIIDQINTVLLVLIVALGISFVLNFTRVGRIYERAAVQFSNVAAAIAASIVFVFGWFVYFNGYVDFIDTVLISLDRFRGAMPTGPWEVAQRYYAILVDLTQRRGIVGFLAALTSERGGVLLALGLLQFAFATRRELREATGAPHKPQRHSFPDR